MLFADIVGSTELAAGSDPEQLRSRLAPFFELVRTVIDEHGGTIEKFIGDAVMAAFGVPRAHGDDPDRAIGAGLALVERVAALAIEVRVGIESGEVLALEAGGDLSVTGDAVNAAARLQSAASPGEVLVGARAARSVRRAELEGPREVVARGFPAPLQAWRATGMLDQPVGASTPFLGREDDFELLKLVYRRAVRERVPELVTIAGEAGIGKTRLASELFDSLRASEPPPTILVGRNPPYGRGIAFWALGEILRGVAGAGPDDSVDSVRAALSARLGELGATDAEEVASGLATAIGGAQGDDVEDLVKHSWRRLVALLAVEGPLVIGIDDAHWADDGLLDLVEETAFRLEGTPVLILCTSRPELLERRPGFGRTARNVTQIELRPLASEAITALAKTLLDGEDAHLVERVAQASGGNPFFAEEVACRFAGDGRGNGDRGIGTEIPETVQAAIAARLDLLPAGEKQAVQYAAVLGHVFLADALADLENAPVDAVLAQLVRKSLFSERVAEGGGRYAFRHHLIRDVAYASLPRGQRAALHERAAEGIAGRAGTRYPELAELVAYHRVEASEQAPSAERERTAWQASLDAADAVARRGASGRAQELFEQAVGLAPGDVERREALRAACNLALRRFRGDEALRLVRQEARMAEAAGENGAAAAAYARAVEVAARMGGITGDLPDEELEYMLDRAEALADADDLETQARLRLNRAWIAWRNGGQGMETPAREGLELARKAGGPTVLSGALDAVTAVEWAEARYESAIALTKERLALVAEDGEGSPALEVERSDATHMLIQCLFQTGDFQEAARTAALAREADLSRGVVYSGWARGLLPAYFLGEWDEALEMAARVREAWTAADRPPVAALATDLACAAAIYEYRDEPTRAADWWAFAEGLLPEKPRQHQHHGLNTLRAGTALHRGRLDHALACVERPIEGWAWWGGLYATTRAEVFALAGREDWRDAFATAEARVGDSAFLAAALARARAAGEKDDELLRVALAGFEKCGARFEAARTAWGLGGAAREDAARVFAELRVPPPVAAS